MTTLLTAPFSAEKGWEWICWIPYLRKIAPQFDRVIVGCDPRMDYFYKDFADEIYHRKNPGKGDRWLDHGKITQVPKIKLKKYREKYPGLKVISPTEQNCTAWKKKTYFKYGEDRRDCRFDIVIHARSLRRYCSQARNWPLVKWAELVDYHPQYRFCCIGTKKDALHIPGTVDLRGVGAEHLCNILASSRLTMGPSSGPMHLAHLCGCPIIVWSSWKPLKVLGWTKKMRNTNKYRYEKLWRAWKDVEVRFIQQKNWQPKVKSVKQVMTNFFRYTEKGTVIPRKLEYR